MTVLPIFSHASTARLTPHDLERFPGEGLFDRIARVVCEAGCLPRKELYEGWEVARRARRLFRGGRVIDLAAGHGLLAHVMLLLDDTSASAIAADPSLPPSASKLHDALRAQWPRLDGRVHFIEKGIEDIELTPEDVVVSAHACGALTDVVLACASAARARVAVLPCCHHLDSDDARKLAGWVDGSLSIDIARAQRLEREGYRLWTQSIAPGITPKARLLLGQPLHGPHGA